MDVSHTAHVSDVSLKETKSGWQMKIMGKNELLLERWSIKKRKSLFQEVFGVNLELD
jgi:hypothetical protein